MSQHQLLRTSLQQYGQNLQPLAGDSKLTFQDFETPGWSSLVNSRSSQETGALVQTTVHNRILDKLNKMKDVDLAESNFNKLKVPEKTASSNVLLYEREKHQLSRRASIDDKENMPVQRLSFKGSEKTRLSSSQQNLRLPLADSILKQSKASSNLNPLLSSISVRTSKHHQSVKNVKRFHQISVHEHLYQNSKRIQTKKMLYQVLQDQYQSQHVHTFQPSINPNSQRLFSIKTSRITNDQTDRCHKDLPVKSQRGQKQQVSSLSVKNKKNLKEKDTLTKLFFLLSKGSFEIDSNILKQTVQSLPLPCLRYLQSLITRIYSGTRYSLEKFIKQTENKKILSNRQGLINAFEKWQARTSQII